MPQLEIRTVAFSEYLQPIQHIRIQVFQLEQGVAAELEFDGLDENSTHLLAYLDSQPVGTTRIRFLNKKQAKIERLAVLPIARKRGIGKQLMLAAIELIKNSETELVIVHAQAYIQELYRQLGFEIQGDRFVEAGISHVKMVKKLSAMNYE
jgi:predicted GNAT family N-acyltransferase